jgi:hypothetical protein
MSRSELSALWNVQPNGDGLCDQVLYLILWGDPA